MTAETTIPQLLAGAARDAPDRPALILDETGAVLTFGELERQSARAASALWELGVRPGDRVAVMLPNVAEFPLAWLAIARIGAAMVSLNPDAGDVDAGHVLATTAPRLALVAADRHDVLARAVALAATGPLQLVTVGTSAAGADAAPAPDFATLLAAAAPEPPAVDVVPEQLASIQFTSGSTGRPKGCRMSHRYWGEVLRLTQEPPWSLTVDDVLLSPLPFFYQDPQWHLLAALRLRIPFVMLRRFSPRTFWARVAHHGATFLYAIGALPTLLLKMDPAPTDRDHAVTRVLCPGIPRELHATLEERFGVPWYDMFGMNEIGGLSAVPVELHDELVGSGCIGRPVATKEARVVDADGAAVPRGEVGELVVRGLGMMDGYHDDAAANARAFRDGWFRTGDLVTQDERGLLFYRGRINDRIRRSGENISAAEVEAAIAVNPAVRLAAVVPVPDEIRGEEPKAYVVPQPGADAAAIEPEALIAACGERLAPFKVPRYWELIEELPLLGSGKVNKQALPRRAGGARPVYDRATGEWAPPDGAPARG